MIGVSSTEFSAYNAEEVLKEVAKEFKHWEIFAEGEHNLQNCVSMLGEIMPSYNKMTFSIHAPICDVNLASLNERMRESSTIEMMCVMEHAANLDIDMVTMHPGMYSLAVPYQEEKTIAALKKSLRTLDNVKREYGVKIAIENMPSFPMMLGKTADELMDIFNGTELGFCFDIGHANTTKQINEIIEKLGNRIINLHIHDNVGENDDHMTIGEGNIDFKDVISKLKNYKGNYIIESKSFQSAVESRDKLDALFKSL